MSKIDPLIQLYGHGTDGSDGLPEGIHLRWFFDRRLGFPFGGFKIYRRELPRDVEEMVWYEENYNDNYGPRKSWSRTFDGITEGEVLISSPNDFLNERDAKAHKLFYFLQFKGQIDFKFPRTIHFAEIVAYIKKGSELQLEGWDTDSSTLVDSDTVSATPYEQIKIKVEGEIDHVRVSAKSGGIFTIKYGWPVVVQTHGTDFQLLNPNYPISLPYTHANYPLAHRHSGQPNGDWLEAKYRRGAESNYRREQFSEMRAVFADVFVNDPSGSLQIRYNNYPAEDDQGQPLDEESELRILPVDLLYLTALDPTIARILGLGGVDTTADPEVTYEYMVEGIWTQGNIWLLEDHVVTFEEQPLGLWPIPYKVIDDLLFNMSNYTIVDQPSDLAQTTRSIEYPSTSVFYIDIRFPEQVYEVQLFISGALGTARADALAGGTLVQTVHGDKALNEQILHLSEPKGFNRISLSGEAIYLHKICYDFEHLGHPESGDVIRSDKDFDLRMGPANLPDAPDNIRLHSQPGQTIAVDGGFQDARLQVGVSWDSDSSEDMHRYSLVRYQLQRQESDDWLNLNNGRAIIINNIESSQSDIPGLPNPPTAAYFVDILSEPMTLAYRVRGMDIFGRVSLFSEPAEIGLTAADYPPPPPPRNVQATFLDTDDPYLPTTDAQLLTAKNSATAIKVTWEWPANLREQAPDVVSFHIHLQSGWLNTLITTVIMADTSGVVGEAGVTINLTSLNNVGYGELVGCTFQSAGLFYPILSNSPQGNQGNVDLVLGRPDTSAKSTELAALTANANRGVSLLLNSRATSDAHIPETGPATIIISPTSPHFKAYSHPSAWEYVRLETVPLSAVNSYTAFIIPPALAPSAAEPKVYAQVTVTSDNGSKQSGTAPPATVVALHRVPPLPPERSPSANTYASFPDVYGQAGFTFQFPGPEHAYEIYRSSLATLIQVDEKERAAGRAEDEDGSFLASYADDPVLQSAVQAEIITPQNIDYHNLDNDLLQALASLPGNERAFIKLHSGKLLTVTDDDNDDFLYHDDTLPGQGAGAYFYRAKAIDIVENSSPLGPASQPVWLRDVTPPRAPDVISVLGGEQKVILRWWPNMETNLAEYRLFRTAVEADAADSRLMNLLAIITPEEHQEEIPPRTDRPNRTRTGYAYYDETVVPGKPYYYRLLAARRLNYADGQEVEILSPATDVLQSQAYDVPPPPPIFDEADSIWVYVDDAGTIHAWDDDLTNVSNPKAAARLVWSTAAPGQVVQIARRPANSSIGSSILNFELGETYNPSHQYFIDKEAPSSGPIIYTGKARSPSGLLSETESTLEISSP